MTTNNKTATKTAPATEAQNQDRLSAIEAVLQHQINEAVDKAYKMDYQEILVVQSGEALAKALLGALMPFASLGVLSKFNTLYEQAELKLEAIAEAKKQLEAEQKAKAKAEAETVKVPVPADFISSEHKDHELQFSKRPTIIPFNSKVAFGFQLVIEGWSVTSNQIDVERVKDKAYIGDVFVMYVPEDGELDKDGNEKKATKSPQALGHLYTSSFEFATNKWATQFTSTLASEQLKQFTELGLDTKKAKGFDPEVLKKEVSKKSYQALIDQMDAKLNREDLQTKQNKASLKAARSSKMSALF